MKNLFLLISILFFYQPVLAQKNAFIFAPALNFDGRIVQQKKLNNNEFRFLKDKEVLKPGFSFQVGIEHQLRKKYFFSIGISYKFFRFGSKKFDYPDWGYINNAPESIVKMDYVNIHYVCLDLSINKLIFYLGSRQQLFVPLDFSCHRNFNSVRYRIHFGPNGEKGIKQSSVIWNPYHKFNFSIGSGLGVLQKFKHKNTKIAFALKAHYFLRPFATRGDIKLNDYLYFSKSTFGRGFDMGLEVKIIKPIGSPE